MMAQVSLWRNIQHQIAQTPQVSYLTADHLGSPRVITNETGEVTTRKDYTAFGEETVSSQRTTALKYDNESETRKGYTGYEKDEESGLDFAQARYYNSSHGRFTSVDPLTASATIKNPQTFNRYSYVLNSPYKFTDPLGLIPSQPIKYKKSSDEENSKLFERVITPTTALAVGDIPESHSNDAGSAPATENTSGSPAESESDQPQAVEPELPPSPLNNNDDPDPDDNIAGNENVGITIIVWDEIWEVSD